MVTPRRRREALNKFINLVKLIDYVEDSIANEQGHFKPKIKTSLSQLLNMIQKWRKDPKKYKHFDLLKLVLDESVIHNVKK